MTSGIDQDANTTTEPSEPARPSGRPARRRRRTLLWLLALLALAGLYGVSLLLTIGNVRDDLLLGRSAAERGRAELLEGDAVGAAASFREARALFERAESRAGSFGVRVIGWLPLVGRTVDAIHAVSESAVTAADATVILAEAAATVPGGLAGLAPTGGRVQVDRIPLLARAAVEADRLMNEALATVEAAPSSLLIGPVGPARRDAEDDLVELRDMVHAGSLLLQGLPTFLGAQEPRRYFFGAQNPAELRGTGGLIGAYSILTIDEGRFEFSPFRPMAIPHPQLEDLPPPNEDFAANYNEFRRGGRFWSAINVMPDFPSVAQAVLSAYEAGTGDRLDGVIVADPFALAALLEATGPVDLPGHGVEVDADNVVAFTTNEAYSLITNSAKRKRLLGDVARAAFESFIARPSGDVRDLETLLRAAGDGHLLVYAEDPTMREGLLETPAGGALWPTSADGELLSVVVNSAAGSKVDYYQEREIDYAVELAEDGTSASVVELTLANHAPSSGVPAYVIGPFGPTPEAGDSIALVNVYCGTDCAPGEAEMDGGPVAVGSRVDLGVRYLQHYYLVPSGEDRTLHLSWEDPEAWHGNNSGGTYRMTFANQVTVRPAALTIRIEPPEGMDIVSASPPLRIEGGAAVYSGEPGPRLDLIVEFRPPLPVKLWRDALRFLNTPVFGR